MTIIQWRKTPRLVNAARKLLAEETLQGMIEALQTSSPLYTPSDGGCAVKHDATQGEELGYIKGWEHCLRQLQYLGVDAPKDTTPIPQNYKE